MPGRPANLDNSRASELCLVGFGYFFSRLSFLFSFSLSQGDGWT